jgi:hypothetical protein
MTKDKNAVRQIATTKIDKEISLKIYEGKDDD